MTLESVASVSNDAVVSLARVEGLPRPETTLATATYTISGR